MTDPHFILKAVKEHYGKDTVNLITREDKHYLIFDDDPEEKEIPLPESVLTKADELENVPKPKSWERAMDFKLEFTPQERKAMRDLARTDPNAEDFLDLLNSVGRVVADDPLLIQGLGYMVTKGKLTQARINEVLGKS